MPDIRLNLGASDDARPGFLSVDIAPPADVVCDLRNDWPWEPGSVTEIYAKDVAEHLGSGYRLRQTRKNLSFNTGMCDVYIQNLLDDVELVPFNGMIHFMNEAHRVLKPGGRMELIAPCYEPGHGMAVWCDPTHASVWTSDTRFYFDERWNDKDGERGRLGPGMGITALFRTLKSCRSGPDWTPIQYAPDAPDRRKLFLLLEAVK